MRSLIERFRQGEERLDVCGLRGGSGALFLARLVAGLERPVCCVLPTDEQLAHLGQDLELFSDAEILSYPSFEIPPYTPLSPDPATVATRLATLYRLGEADRAVIVLTSAEALLRRILPAQVLADSCELIMAGEETDREELIATLVRLGYQSCDLVRHPGDFAVRGGIVDLYAPPASPAVHGPIRLDFFGDLVESIRVFDPVSQRSQAELEEVILLPATDILFPAGERAGQWPAWLEQCRNELAGPESGKEHLLEQLREQVRFPGIEFCLPLLYQRPGVETLFSYLPAGTIMAVMDPPSVRQQMDLVTERIRVNHREATAADLAVLPPERLFLDPDEVERILAGGPLLNLCPLPDPDSRLPRVTVASSDHGLLRQEIDLQRRRRGVLAPLVDRLVEWLERKETIVLACRSEKQAGHFAEMLKPYRIPTTHIRPPLHLSVLAGKQALHLVDHPLSRGFDLDREKCHVLSAAELFGEKRIGPRTGRRGKRPSEAEPVRLDDLQVNDVVVHRDHGLGSFQGLLNMEFAGQRGDFMLIEYRDGDRLYVPVDRLHLVSRYQGLSEERPRLDRLGSDHWRSTKKKVTDAVWEVANELIQIYARRAIRSGHAFSPPGTFFRELEESFPYEETRGQATAIEDVLADMTSARPMDRLVCGDVGYGKTEVAVRAAFKAIEDGFQVAVLVPTTVLAEQHAATFRDRFASFPVEVGCLTRFRSSSEQKKIIRHLAEGRLDLVVGTHRLLSRDVRFSRLGLLVVDEEHRFGVTHKEKIKKLRAAVDVLTLTATPIPRTLQMSLLGIRDLSVISTPPRKRQAVKTFLARFDDLVIREAVSRELARNGQVFFVHNRVRTISRIAERIARLVPGARVGVAHGQMPGSRIEEVMVRFINHEIDVLVCTTIIESGLDIPNANTIIINRADHLGLADIYQLRGRVGRSTRQAYAYLLVPSLEGLTRDAKQRLRALMDCSELGGGFKLAMNDLQIRGGGNLLGVSQSGHIAAVGYDLYLELLQATVKELKNSESGEEPDRLAELDPEIKLRVAAFLPDQYVQETGQRYQLYRRISAAGNRDPQALGDLEEELVDRYGPLPPEARTLFRMIGLKYRLRRLGISKLEQGDRVVVFSFIDRGPVRPEKILALVTPSAGKKKKHRKAARPEARLTPDNRLVVSLQGQEDPFGLIDTVLDFLES